MGLRFTLLIFLINLSFSFQIPKPGLSGEFGFATQYEHNSDSTRQRRPAGGYSLGFNTLFSWLFLNADLKFFYNSDDKFTAQKINQFGLSLCPSIPSWRWLKIYFGDFSPTFSEYTLSGISVSGMGLELTPGHWRFALINGNSRRVSRDSLDWSYRRSIFALRCGSEYLSLIFLKSQDDTSSLKPTDTIVPIPPQENLVLGISSDFTIAKILSFDLEGAGSVHTRDLRNDTMTLKGLPRIAYSFYTPRYSSHTDFALRGALKFNPKFATLNIGFQLIGPGFTSFGLPYIKNDMQKWDFGIATKTIPKTTIRFDLKKEVDNLIKDKLATTRTNSINFSLVLSPLQMFNIAGTYNQKNTRKETANDSFKVNSLSHTFSFMPNFNISFLGINQNLIMVLSYQAYEDRLPLSSTPDSKVLSIGLNYSITPKIPITFNTNLSKTYNLSGIEETNPESYHSYGLTANRALFKEKLINNLTFCYQPSTLGDNYSLNGSHSYLVTQKDALNFLWYLGFFFSAEQGNNNFNLQMLKLSYNRRI